MSITSRLSENSNIIKILIAIIALILIVGGGYSYYKSNSSSATQEQEQSVETLSIDRDMAINSVENIEEVIAYWIDNNPEAIIASVTKMQQKAQEAQLQAAQKSISQKSSELYDKSYPSYAPKKYDITIVEFYDYNCGYCKQVNKSVEALLDSDKKVRIIYKDFPILGKLSKEISAVSIAVSLTDSKKFRKFHNKLMSNRVASQEAAIILAGQAGVDVAKLRKTLSSKKSKIEAMLQANLQLGSQIGISGTPAFVIGDELAPGALDVTSLKAKIAAQRKK